MGFKDLFIAKEETNNLEDIDVSQYLNDPELNIGQTMDVDVNVDTGAVVSVEEIYASAGLSNLERSIFKVEEIRKVLPANLPNEAKKVSVIGMMQVSNIALEEVLVDANTRVEALKTVASQFEEETNAIVTECNAQIAQHEAEIERLKSQKLARSKDQEDQEELIAEEIKKVEAIKAFIM